MIENPHIQSATQFKFTLRKTGKGKNTAVVEYKYVYTQKEKNRLVAMHLEKLKNKLADLNLPDGNYFP